MSKKPECMIGYVRQLHLTDPSFDAMLLRLGTDSDKFVYTICPAPPLATVSWARSKVASDFLNHTTADVMVMMDSDMSAEPPEFELIAEEALSRDAVVGSLLSKRAPGRGFCNKMDRDVHVYSDEVWELEKGESVGAAMTAFPRTVLERMSKLLPWMPIKKMWPFFLDRVVRVEHEGEMVPDLQTEDRAFCEMAQAAGEKIFVHLYPAVQHWGLFGYRPHHAQEGIFTPQHDEAKDEHA